MLACMNLLFASITMSKKKSTTPNNIAKSIESSSPFQAIESLCLKCTETSDQGNAYRQGDVFARASKKVNEVISDFKFEIQEISLASVILLWSQYALDDRILGSRNLKMMSELFNSGVIPLEKSHKAFSLQDLNNLGHEVIIDKLRSFLHWPIQKREEIISLYIEFGSWLSKMTFGYIPHVKDPDKLITAHREFAYDEYVNLISYLPDRERVLCKLFYLGGNRSLEEVLNLKVKDVDFKTSQINFEKYSVHYPGHVFQELKHYLAPRKKGHVFLSKQGERVHHTVPYRALKTATTKLNLPTSFTFKDLSKDR